MTLSSLIRKRDTGSIATAIPAISATRKVEGGGTVARIATIAVANPKEGQLPADEESAIRAWLTHIGESDQEIIAEVLGKCRTDMEALAYFMRRATETDGKPRTLLDKQRETRRQKVIALLEDSPDIQRAYFTDLDSDPHNVILAIGIRHVATFEMEIDKAKYDPFKLLQLIGQHGQITH